MLFWDAMKILQWVNYLQILFIIVFFLMSCKHKGQFENTYAETYIKKLQITIEAHSIKFA